MSAAAFTKNTEVSKEEVYGYDDDAIIMKNMPISTTAPIMPLLSISSPETIQKCASLSLRPNDIFICSYPKSGTTWMQHIVLSLLFQHQHQHQTVTTSQKRDNSDNQPFFYNHVSEYAPFFEIDPHWNDNDNELVSWIQENHAHIGRRIFNTHLRFDMLPKPPPPSSSTTSSTQQQDCCGGKFIYIIRSPVDACVSFYHHLSHQVQGGYNGSSLDEFFQDWLVGKIAFGSWLDHVQSYTTGVSTTATTTGSSSSSSMKKVFDNGIALDDDNICAATQAFTSTSTNNNNSYSRCVLRLMDGREFFFVTYEEMCCNLPAVVTDLRHFLDLTAGSTTRTNIDSDDELLLLQTFSFAYMKANQERFQPKSVEWKNNFSFLRKGVPGDATMVLSSEQQEQFQTVLKKSPLWQQLMDENDKSSSSDNNNNSNHAVLSLLLSKIKRLLVTESSVEPPR